VKQRLRCQFTRPQLDQWRRQITIKSTITVTIKNGMTNNTQRMHLRRFGT